LAIGCRASGAVFKTGVGYQILALGIPSTEQTKE
jgi:hypothetical protein